MRKLLNAIASSLQIQIKIFFKQCCLSANALVNFLVLRRIWAVSDGFPAIPVWPNRNHEIFRQRKSSADSPLDHNFELQGRFLSLHGATSRDISSAQVRRFESFGSALSLRNTRQIIASTRAKTASKCLTFLIALASIVFAVGSPVSAQSAPILGFPPGVFDNTAARAPSSGGGGGPVFTYQGYGSSGSNSPVIYTITAAGSWASGDLIVAGVATEGKSGHGKQRYR